MIINFRIDTTNRNYSLSYESIQGITEIAAYLKANNIIENRIINTGYEMVDHTFDEIQELSKVALSKVNDHIEELRNK